MTHLLTVKEAAEYLSCSDNRMLELIRSGQLRAAKPGKSYLIKPEWLDAYLEDEADRLSNRASKKPIQTNKELPNLDIYLKQVNNG